MSKSFYLTLFSFLVMNPVFGGFDQNMGSQLKGAESPYERKDDNSREKVKLEKSIYESDKIKKDGIFIQGSNTNGKKSDNTNRKITARDKLNSFGEVVQGVKTSNSEKYLTHKNKEIFYSGYRAGDISLSLSYLQDTFDVTDRTGVYNRTYETGRESHRRGFLQVGIEHFISRSTFLDFSLGGNFGVGLSSGNGIFPSTNLESSDSSFNFWMIPVDLSLSISLPLWHWGAVSISGGPSVIGVIQNRSDYEEGEKGKRVNQVSTGYFGSLSLRISFPYFFRKNGFSNFSDYKSNNSFLNIFVRTHQYRSFPDDFTMSGVSFGAGILFEFL